MIIIKRIIVILFVVMVTGVFINEKENILIPDEAIRFRVIANSDSEVDQDIKMEIKNKVEDEIYKLIRNVESINEARYIIESNLDKVDNIIKNYNLSYDISYGDNYFPTKTYKGIDYEEGNYESLVITLGSGKGENWWCVLFPPLCLLDEQKDITNKDYEFYATKLINKFK